jgi:DNA-binding response OmpR family regulator
MGHVLEKEYTVCQSTDGSQALDILKTTHVDIIVSDVMMEGMDGMELCRRVKTDITISHIPLILLTARALDADQLKGLQLGADDYITKPFNFEILRQRIRNILQRTERAKETFKNEIEVKPSAITVTTLDEEFIAKAIKIVEENMKNADFSVDDLAGAMSMHRTSLYKKILAITGQTPLLFIRSLKMKRAHQMMSRGGVRVAQVAYEVGFNSPKIFARYFKEEYGVTPTEFMRQNE